MAGRFAGPSPVPRRPPWRRAAHREVPVSQLEAFLGALFEHLPPGFIEVRVLEDKKGGRLLARRWYPTPAALLAIVPKMAEFGESHNAGVFFGVLPRRADGVGKAADTLPGLAAWIDLDFRDHEGGEDVCRETLGHFTLPPTALVHSGHGLHAYWLMKEPEEPHVLVDLSARLAVPLGGDHVADAARILRLPGTSNRKDPAHPLPVVIESLDLGRRYSPCDFDEILPPLSSLPGAATRAQAGERPADSIIGQEIPERVRTLLDAHPRLQSLFQGRGKPGTDEQGQRLDTTSSGYDYSLVYALAKKGVRDEAELATALWHRPDDAARSKGLDYVLRTVRKVLARMAPPADDRRGQGGASAAGDDGGIDFVVDRIRIFDSDPPVYEFTIGGTVLKLGSSHLLSRAQFCARFLDGLRRVPALPSKAQAWRELVNDWLAHAEVVEQPPEASQAELLRQQIAAVIASLTIGDSADELDQGKGLRHDGTLIFKTLTVLKLLKDTYGEVSAHVLCSYLRDLGFESKPVRLEGKLVRVWCGRRETSAPAAESASTTAPVEEAT